MPRRFFRKFAIKRHELGDSWVLRPFQTMMHEPRYWGIRRRTVVPAFALGLFMSFMPFPLHPLWAALIALATRINIPIAVATTFVSNPLTMGPMYLAAYHLGAFVLNLEPQPFAFEMSIDWFLHTFVRYWQPISLGCVMMGTIAGAIGYVVVDVLWRLSLHEYKTMKRKHRAERESGER